MAITLELSHDDGTTTTRTVESGAAVPVDPSTRLRIRVDDQLIGAATITRLDDLGGVTLALPDGQIVRLLGFVDIIAAPERR